MIASDVLPQEFNVATYFVDRNLAEGRGSRPAFFYEDRVLTYADVQNLANRTGNALLELGIGPEDRVWMLCLDAPEFLGTFWGAIKIGAVPIPTNTVMRTADYVYFLRDSRAKVAVVSAPLLAEAGPALGESPYLRHVLVAGGHAGSYMSWEDRIARASSTLSAAPTSRDDAAFWLYSSGSTGFPKGCVHLQHDMHVCAELYAKPILRLSADDVTFSAAKLYFAYGLGNGLYFPLAVGGSAVHFAGRVTPEAAFRVIAEQRPTVFFGVPTLYAAMLAMPDAASRFDTSSLRLCVSAGESLPADLYTRWRDRFGTEILDGIGSTEVLHIFISNVPGQVVPGSTGRVVPGYEALLADEEGGAVPRGEIGNLLICGDSTCSHYWNKHDRTKATILGQWIQTGDKYYQDEAGNYWYCGRSDDMLKVSGQWVSPVEVEGALIAHPSVLEAAVVGRADDEGLIKPQAFIVLQEGEQPSDELAEALKQHVKTTLTPVKYPRWIVFVLELPKTATGKIQRYILRNQLAEGNTGEAQ